MNNNGLPLKKIKQKSQALQMLPLDADLCRY